MIMMKKETWRLDLHAIAERARLSSSPYRSSMQRGCCRRRRRGLSASSSSSSTTNKTLALSVSLLLMMLLLSTLTVTSCFAFMALPQRLRRQQSMNSRKYIVRYATIVPIEGETEESTTSNNKNKRISQHQEQSQHQSKKGIELLSPAQIENRIVTLGRQGKTLQALDTFEAISHPTIRQVNAAIDACARARPVQVERAFDILRQCSNSSSSRNNNKKNPNLLPQPNVYTFGSLMSVCARAGRVDLAVDLLKIMQQDPYNVKPNAVVYNTAIAACDKSHPPQPTTALRLLQQASEQHGLSISVVGYNAALSAAARAGDWQGAIQLLERMENNNNKNQQQQGTSVPSIPRPDAVTYGTILSAFERAEEWDQLMTFAEKIKNINNIQLDGMALTSILHACQRLGLAQQAVFYLQEMKNLQNVHPVRRSTAGWQVAGHREPLQGPDAVAYLLAISANARGGAWTKGIELLEEYLHENPISLIQNNNTVSTDSVSSSLQQRQQQQHAVALYTAAISGCEYAGEWQAAFGLLDRMRQAGVEPNEVTYATVIGACATACNKFMSSSSSSSSEYYRSRQVRHPHGDTGPPIPPLRHALRLLRVLHSSDVVKPNIQIYNAAIRACAEACDLHRAFRLLEMIRNSAAQAPHDDGDDDQALLLRPNIVTYGTLMTACERVGSIEGMNKVFRLVHEEKDENGQSLLAKNEVIYGAAISCCRKTGQSERAFLLLQKMIKEGLEPNVATFNTVLMAQTEASTKNAMRNGGSSGSSSGSTDDGVISSTAKDIERAVQVYNMLKSSPAQQQSPMVARPNRLTYNILVRFLAENMLPREAEVLLQEMRKMANLVPDVHLYTSVVASYERTRQPLRALRLMESMNEDGYDFYEVKVLNAAFKRLLKLANAVVEGVGGGGGDGGDDDGA